MNFADFHFIRPYWLLALIPTILMVTLLLKNKLNQANWSTVCDKDLLPFVLQNRSTHHSRFMLLIGAFSSLLVVLALAGPTWERIPAPVFRNEAALVIALDLSSSMDAADIKPSRLVRARFKIVDILKQRKDGQTALIVYSNDAFTVTPLTNDTETIASQVSALTTDIMPGQGSNTAAVLDRSVELLKQAGFQSGEILLVTDGIDNSKSHELIEAIAGYNLSILGVGTAEGAPIKYAQGGFIKDKKGNIVIPKLNARVLAQLAKQGHGIYQTISSDSRDIDTLLSRLNKPLSKEGSEDNNMLIDQWNEKGPWLLLLVLPLAAIQFRKGILFIALISLFPLPEAAHALQWTDLWHTQDQQAQKAFQQEQYEQAATQFNQPQWKAVAQYKAGKFQQAAESLKKDQTATGQYNLGNALAKTGQLKQAIEAYGRSLKLDPDNEDAKYNKEQVEKELDKQQNNQQQEDEQQKSDQEDKRQKEDKNQQQQSGDSEEKNNDNQNEQKQEQQSESDQQQTEQRTESKQNNKTKPDQPIKQNESDPKESEKAIESTEYDETEQANEQWLNRIPDDPAGLLKRKFKYQYGQRGGKSNNSNAW